MYDFFYIGENDQTWEHYKKKYPHAKRVQSDNPYQSCSAASFTKMFWVISDYVDFLFDWDFELTIPDYDFDYIHIWPIASPDGKKLDLVDSSIQLISRKNARNINGCNIDFSNIKLYQNIAATYVPYDIFYTGGNESTYQLYRQKYPHIKKVHTKNTYKDCAELSMTKMFWVIPDTVEFLPNWEFITVMSLYDTDYIHIWPVQKLDSKNLIEQYDLCIQLWPTCLAKKTVGSDFDPKNLSGKLKIHDNTAAIYAANFDIFFVSYNEINANENWYVIKEKFPRAKRVHGIKGINNAHRRCAELSDTEMFWTIDGDTIPNYDWQFKYHVTKFDKDYIHIWYSKNPINNLEYGYGAIKLWPKQKVLDYNGNWFDYTTSVGEIKIVNCTIATTRFNTSPYETWKSSLRESIKLIKNIEQNPDDLESVARLQTWSTVFLDVPFANWAKIGYQDAVKWHNDSPEFLNKINDFEWLELYFHNNYKD